MSHDSIEHQPHLEDAEGDPLLSGTLTRRQFAVGGLTLGAAALLATKGVSVAEAAGAAKGSLVPTKFFHERINDVKAYPEKGTCVVLLGAGGGPDAYFNHGGSVAIWSRGSVYLVDFGIGMHRQFFSARLAPKSLKAVFLSHLHSDHFASLYPFFSEAYYYFLPPYAPTMPTVKLFGPPSAATNAPAGSNGLPEGAPYLINPGNPTPGTIDTLRSWVEGPYAYDNNLRAAEEGMPDILGLFGGTPLLAAAELPVPAGASFTDPAPDMDPVQVYEDDRVSVSTILVDHSPLFPSYAFRFETEDGSITISGDTCAHPNLIKLASKTDVLIHEAIHVGYLDWLVAVAGYPPKLFKHLSRTHTLHHSVDMPEIELKADGVGVVAKKAEAKKLVLYHLVPTMDIDPEGRAFDIPPEDWVKAPSKEFGRKVVVGTDLLRVDL
jgi:ribonuclease BN (tRNA processing enzyme)